MEEKLHSVISEITRSDRTVYKRAVEKWDSIAKPLRSLGILEEDIARIAALTGTVSVSLNKRTLFVICADNGVVGSGVSQSDESVTQAVAEALGKGESTVNYMARVTGCEVIPVDCGMSADTPNGVISKKIKARTGNIAEEEAMTREECIRAILTGIELVRQQKEAGCDIILLGEMGIGNTTTTAAVTSVLLDLPAEETAGYGAGLSEEGLQRKRSVIRQALSRNNPDPSDPIDILSRVGGLDLAVLCGICLGGAWVKLPVVMDGVITNAAALCAVRLCDAAGDALLASHASEEPAAKALLKALNLPPVIRANLHLGEGTGAVMLLPLLDAALSVYESGHGFNAIGVEAYQCLH